jgi:hypothetical protein
MILGRSIPEFDPIRLKMARVGDESRRHLGSANELSVYITVMPHIFFDLSNPPKPGHPKVDLEEVFSCITSASSARTCSCGESSMPVRSCMKVMCRFELGRQCFDRVWKWAVIAPIRMWAMPS